MSRILGLLLAMALAIPISPVFADAGQPPVSVTNDQVALQVVVHSSQVNLAAGDRQGYGEAATDGSGTVIVGGMTVEWSNGVGWNPTSMRHEFGQTQRVAGSGNYETEVHSTLIDGPYYGGNQVFSNGTDSCAQVYAVNATARTCSSLLQPSSSGHQWFIISGHSFNVGIGGTWDAECPGCIDWVWTQP